MSTAIYDFEPRLKRSTSSPNLRPAAAPPSSWIKSATIIGERSLEIIQATKILAELQEWASIEKNQLVEKNITLVTKMISFLKKEHTILDKLHDASSTFQARYNPWKVETTPPLDVSQTVSEEQLKMKVLQQTIQRLEQELAKGARFAGEALRLKIEKERTSITYTHHDRTIEYAGRIFKDLLPVSKDNSKRSALDDILVETYRWSGDVPLEIRLGRKKIQFSGTSTIQKARDFLKEVMETAVRSVKQTLTLMKAHALKKSISTDNSAPWTDQLAKLERIDVEELLVSMLSTASK